MKMIRRNILKITIFIFLCALSASCTMNSESKDYTLRLESHDYDWNNDGENEGHWQEYFRNGKQILSVTDNKISNIKTRAYYLHTCDSVFVVEEIDADGYDIYEIMNIFQNEKPWNYEEYIRTNNVISPLNAEKYIEKRELKKKRHNKSRKILKHMRKAERNFKKTDRSDEELGIQP